MEISMYKIGHKHSEETKRKIANAHRGKKRLPFSEEWKQNLVLSRKGYKHSENTKKKIGMGNRGKIRSGLTKFKLSETRKELFRLGLLKSTRGSSHSEEAKQKMRNAKINYVPWNKGIPHSEETKAKISLRHKGRISPRKGILLSEKSKIKISEKLKELYSDPKNHPLYGKNMPQEIKDKISKSLIESGASKMENNPSWKGGISFEPYGIDFNNDLKKHIRQRDNLKCQLCNGIQENRLFHTHHIDYDKKNNNPNNLITLCCSCHMKTNYKREHWTKYFREVSSDAY